MKKNKTASLGRSPSTLSPCYLLLTPFGGHTEVRPCNRALPLQSFACEQIRELLLGGKDRFVLACENPLAFFQYGEFDNGLGFVGAHDNADGRVVVSAAL